MTKAPKRPRGLICPVCAVPLWVIRTRAPAPGVVVRCRFCKTCGHREVTEERKKAQ